MPVSNSARTRIMHLVTTMGLSIGLAAMDWSAAASAPTTERTLPRIAERPVGCGPELTKANGTPWICSFADNFGGTTLNANKWNVLTTARTGGQKFECRVDDERNVAVRDGSLRLKAITHLLPINCQSSMGDYSTRFSAGAVTTSRHFAQTYGRFEVRARMPKTALPGYHSAMWMYPQDPAYGAWPASGEIDTNEYRTYIFGRPAPTLHWAENGEHQMVTERGCYVQRPHDFHKYVLVWTKSQMRFVYDGKVCMRHQFDLSQPAGNKPFDRPFFLILNQSHGGQLNLATDLTPRSSTMVVDYVRAWR